MNKIVNKESLILSAVVLVSFTLGVAVGSGFSCKCHKNKHKNIKHEKQVVKIAKTKKAF